MTSRIETSSLTVAATGFLHLDFKEWLEARGIVVPDYMDLGVTVEVGPDLGLALSVRVEERLHEKAPSNAVVDQNGNVVGFVDEHGTPRYLEDEDED